MDAFIKKNIIIILIIVACLYVPFYESYSRSTLWGLNWYSPQFMDQLGGYLLPVKLLLVIIGLVLLYNNIRPIKEVLGDGFISAFFVYSSYSIATIQILFLCLGLLFSSISLSDPNYLHKEKLFDNYSIYVYTADPGAMGKAYHYFYLKCSLPLNRYELKLIKKMGWMYEYGFEVLGSNLIVTDKNKEGKTHTFDVRNFSCNVQT